MGVLETDYAVLARKKAICAKIPAPRMETGETCTSSALMPYAEGAASRSAEQLDAICAVGPLAGRAYVPAAVSATCGVVLARNMTLKVSPSAFASVSAQ